MMNIRVLDLKYQGVPSIIAAFLVESGGELALVETGPGSTLPACLEALGAWQATATSNAASKMADRINDRREIMSAPP